MRGCAGEAVSCNQVCLYDRAGADSLSENATGVNIRKGEAREWGEEGESQREQQADQQPGVSI